MDRDAAIMVTGAAGFIGSCLLSYLNQKGYYNLVIVDDFSDVDKKPNWTQKKFSHKVEREDLFAWLESSGSKIDFVFHLGARTDTTEFDYSIHEQLNVAYSKKIWHYCGQHQIPLVYASSAATYGAGEFGYDDDHTLVEKLQPLNPYGVSKNEFDKWVLQQISNIEPVEPTPPFWAGLKFFNVYGPNEYHKGRMASVIFHSYNQLQQAGKVRLFRSHRPEYKDGEQLRDFIYVNDVVKICYWFMEHRKTIAPGLYNVGTGQARTFNDLVAAISSSLQRESKIEYIDTPADIRDKYQYFTEANVKKLRTAGYRDNFSSLEEGVRDYVTNFLVAHNYY